MKSVVIPQGARLIDEKDVPDDPDALLAQVQVRREMQARMVGSLYPNILQGQIDRLLERHRAVKYGNTRTR